MYSPPLPHYGAHSLFSSDSRAVFCSSGWTPSTSSRALVSAVAGVVSMSVESSVSDSSLLSDNPRNMP